MELKLKGGIGRLIVRKCIFSFIISHLLREYAFRRNPSVYSLSLRCLFLLVVWRGFFIGLVFCCYPERMSFSILPPSLW